MTQHSTTLMALAKENIALANKLFDVTKENKRLKSVLIKVHNNGATWTGQNIIRDAIGEINEKTT